MDVEFVKMLLVLITTLSLSGCAGMLLGGTTSGEASRSGGRAATTTNSDSAISGAIRQQYTADGQISRFPIGIRSVGGRVVLTGTVASYELRDRVVDIARNTRGVTSVDSRVTVNTNY